MNSDQTVGLFIVYNKQTNNYVMKVIWMQEYSAQEWF